MDCINCNTNFTGDFCPNCGEKRDVPRITFFSIADSLLTGFVNMDRGLLYNVRYLTTAPKTTILEYIKGKRKYILNPVSYAIITISVYIIIDSLIKIEKPTYISDESIEKI